MLNHLLMYFLKMPQEARNKLRAVCGLCPIPLGWMFDHFSDAAMFQLNFGEKSRKHLDGINKLFQK